MLEPSRQCPELKTQIQSKSSLSFPKIDSNLLGSMRPFNSHLFLILRMFFELVRPGACQSDLVQNTSLTSFCLFAGWARRFCCGPSIKYQFTYLAVRACVCRRRRCPKLGACPPQNHILSDTYCFGPCLENTFLGVPNWGFARSKPHTFGHLLFWAAAPNTYFRIPIVLGRVFKTTFFRCPKLGVCPPQTAFFRTPILLGRVLNENHFFFFRCPKLGFANLKPHTFEHIVLGRVLKTIF